MADDPKGQGLKASAGKCQDCDCEHDVIAYCGSSLCFRCLATRGIMLTNLNEGAEVRQRITAQHQAVARSEASAAQDRLSKAHEAARLRKIAASERTPRRQVDADRLLRRTRGAVGG